MSHVAEIHQPWMQMTISSTRWSEKRSKSFKSWTNEKSKPWFSKMSAVHFQIVPKLVSGSCLLDMWHSWFPKFLRSFTNDWYLLPNMTFIILVNNVRSKSRWSVNPMDRQIIWCLLISWDIIDCSDFSLLSVGQFSFLKNTSQYIFLTP